MPQPHSPADHETTPLLNEHDGERRDTFLARFGALTQEPLTALTKLLLAIALILLILASVFIGLFAGAEHRLSSLPKSGDKTVTLTRTAFSATITETRTATITASPPGPTLNPPEQQCFSAECIVLSASILNSIDTSQDPCENFYDFANGGWLQSNPLPADKGIFGTFNQVSLENQRIIQQILSENSTLSPSPDSQTLAKLQDFYGSCLDEGYLNTLGIKPLTDIIQHVKNLFKGSSTAIKSPLTAQHVLHSESKRGLTAAVSYLHSRGIGALFLFDIDGDVGVDPNKMSLWFKQPGLGLPSKEYFEDDVTRKLYSSVIERIFLALGEKIETPTVQKTFWPPFPWPPWGGDDDGGDGGDHDRPGRKKPGRKKTARELADAVVHFERQIARAELALDAMQDPVATYNPMPFAKLAESVPEIDFATYWSAFAPRSFPERVIVTYPDYLTSLSSLLSKTPPDVLEGYLVARASLSLAEYLGPNTTIWKAARDLSDELKGIKKGTVEDRKEFCVGKVESALGFAAGRFFVKETFGGRSQAKAIRVIQDIVDIFKSSLNHLDWMDKKSAHAAAKKASAIRIKVGFPLSPNTSDAQAIAAYYSRVTIDRHDFFGNMLSSSIFEETLEWAKLGRQRDKESWEMVPSTVNAYFNPPANEIVFPAGILRPPFFSQQWPAYLTYGAFGAVAAHELTHAFDSAGRLYDQNGKLRQWWSNATSEAFEERKECISRQYSNYTVEDGKGGHVHVNGNLTSGENIGDSGLIQAYRAWKSQFNTSFIEGHEYLLPGLNFTREQLFFISFGRVWAQQITPAAAVQRVRTDPHSPNRFRVEGTLVNMESSTFAAAFNCPVGSKLNPPEEQQCKLW